MKCGPSILSALQVSIMHSRFPVNVNLPALWPTRFYGELNFFVGSRSLLAEGNMGYALF